MSDARIKITADAAQAEATMLRLGDVVQGLSGRFQDLAGMAGALGGALSVTAFAALVKSAIDSADALNDLSKRTGASVEILSGFRLAAEQSGTSLEGIANGTKKLATSMVEHEDVFKKLGINTKSQSEALIQLGDVFAGMEDPVKRSALAVKIFGKSGDEMLPMLMEGSDGIRRMVERGQELSGVTTQMAQNADRFNDSMAELKLSSKNLYIGIADELLPVLNESIEAFNGVNKTGSSTSVIAEAIATAMETVVVIGANVAYVFNSVGREIGGIVAQFSAMGEAGGIFSKSGREAWTRVGQEMRADAEAARKEIDSFTERILTARQRMKDAASSGDTGSGKKDDRGGKLLAGLTDAATEAAKLRQKDIDGWVKYADAVLAEGDRVDEIARKQVEDVNAAQEAKAKAVLDNFNSTNQSLADAVSQQDLSEQQRIERQRDMELVRLEQQRQTLLDNNAWTLETETSFELARINAKARADAAFIKLDKQNAQQRQQVLVGALATISSLMSNSNVALFRIGQAASIANATISTIEGATKALALGPIIGPPLAAMIYAAGIANVAQIAGTEIGGGTPSPVNATFSGGSVASGTTPTPITALPAPNAGFEPARQQINLTLIGKTMDFDTMVNEFVPLLKEASANGAFDIQVTRG